MRGVGPIAGVLVVNLVAPVPVNAATRVCREIVAVSGEDRASELVAKQRALAGWTLAASQFGPAFTLWRNAHRRSLSCLRLSDGTHRCQAYGHPCGISQVAGQPPRGSRDIGR